MRNLISSALLPLVFLGIYGSLMVALPANALTVSPVKIELRGDPGQKLEGTIELFNEQAEAKTFFTSFENFESRGDSGAPYFTGSGSGLATWLSVPAEITIGTGERAELPYTITIPQEAKPGGYFAAIFLGTEPPRGTGGGEVTIGGKIGVLILLRVNGEVEESAGLIDFGAKDGKKFFTSTPVYFEYGFNNTGGDRVVPRGEISIRNSLRLRSATLLANEREGNVLPDSTRRFEIVWEEDPQRKDGDGNFFDVVGRQLRNFHFGWYTAKLSVAWGAESQTAHATYHFFIFPWQLLLSFAVLVLVVWLLMKRYNRYVISRATLS